MISFQSSFSIEWIPSSLEWIHSCLEWFHSNLNSPTNHILYLASVFPLFHGYKPSFMTSVTDVSRGPVTIYFSNCASLMSEFRKVCLEVGRGEGSLWEHEYDVCQMSSVTLFKMDLCKTSSRMEQVFKFLCLTE